MPTSDLPLDTDDYDFYTEEEVTQLFSAGNGAERYFAEQMTDPEYRKAYLDAKEDWRVP